MLVAFFLLALVGADSAESDPAILIEELGSPRYRQRELAEARLTRLGRVAMPALRAALKAKDPEIQLRASSILSRIEATLLVEPTPIAFDFRDAPILDVIREINHRSGLSLQFIPEDDQVGTAPRITLRTDEPLPFWQGIDALCKAGGLHYDFGAALPAGRRDRSFALYPGASSSLEPVWDSGPFRTVLSSVHYQSEIHLSRSRPAIAAEEVRPAFGDPLVSRPSVPNRQFYFQLMTAAEPRLSITRNGDPRVTEAFDDQGKSLLMPAAHATLQRTSGYFGMNPSPQIRFRIDLAYPESSSRRIRRLKGTLPVLVSTRKPDPLKIPFEGATGKSFRSADVDLTILEIRSAQDGQPSTIELTLKPVGGALSTASEPVVDPLAARLESPQEQLEILDETGKPLDWFPSSSTFDGEKIRLTLSLIPRNRPTRPSMIAHHGMMRVATEVSFEFSDVPIP